MPSSPNKTEEELDAEFIKIFSVLKPYITCINNKHYIELVRLWLEKLSNVSFKNKAERNKYLINFKRQLEVGKFESPFTNPPPSGALPSYEEIIKINPGNQVEYPQNIYQVNYLQTTQANEDYQDCSSENNFSRYSQFQKALHNTVPKLNLSEIGSDRSEQIMNGEEICNFKNHCTMLKQKLQQDLVDFEQAKVQLNNTEEAPTIDYREAEASPHRTNRDTESSWYDLSEMTLQSGAAPASEHSIKDDVNSGDMLSNREGMIDFYEKRIVLLMNIIDELKHENMCLKESLEQSQEEMNLRNSNAETSITNLTNEVLALKERLQELTDIKESLQTSHYAMSNEWQANMLNLEKKLETCQKKNIELRSVVIILEQKLTEKSKQLRRKASDEIAREVKAINQLHEANIQEMTNSFNCQLKKLEIEHNNKIINLRKSYDNQILDIKEELQRDLTFRDTEILRLKNELENQIQRNHELVLQSKVPEKDDNSFATKKFYEDKIQFLQKCIIKLEKLFHKSEKDFIKKIIKLKSELDSNEKAYKLNLTKQRAELLTNPTGLQQNQVDSLINQLEERYVVLLKKNQQDYKSEKQADTETINKLQQEIIERAKSIS